MAGWIVQGVRGEGKGLAAVWMMKKYLNQGFPVATNMDLYLDKLLDNKNASLAYRLPDFTRVQDFNILPPAFDPAYKPEDKNGLIVLDELALWMNSRTFKDKQRLAIIGWLILSRKNHWDLLLTVQNYEMIDAQIRTTLCDFLVQASRTDRQKIPVFGSFLSFLGFSPYGKQHHVYHVFYGMSLNQAPQDTWSFSGKEVYDGYDTNQKLQQDNLIIKGETLADVQVIDFRATYTYLPANYLSGQVHIQKEQKAFDLIQEKHKATLKNLKNPSKYVKPEKPEETPEQETEKMAVVKGTGSISPKMILLALGLVGFVGYRFIYPPSLPNAGKSEPKAAPTPALNSKSIEPKSISVPISTHLTIDQIETAFLDDFLTNYRPRLSSIIEKTKGSQVIIDFFDSNFKIVETLNTEQLHELGATIIQKNYGVFLRTKENMMLVTSWELPKRETKEKEPEPQQAAKNTVKKEESGGLLANLMN